MKRVIDDPADFPPLRGDHRASTGSSSPLHGGSRVSPSFAMPGSSSSMHGGSRAPSGVGGSGGSRASPVDVLGHSSAAHGGSRVPSGVGGSGGSRASPGVDVPDFDYREF